MDHSHVPSLNPVSQMFLFETRLFCRAGSGIGLCGPPFGKRISRPKNPERTTRSAHKQLAPRLRPRIDFDFHASQTWPNRPDSCGAWIRQRYNRSRLG